MLLPAHGILSTKRHGAIVSTRSVGGYEIKLTYHVGQVEANLNSHGSTHGGWNMWPQGSWRTSVPRVKSSVQMTQLCGDGSVGDGGSGTDEGDEGDGGSETDEGDGGNGARVGNPSSVAVGGLARRSTRLHHETESLRATNGSSPPISGSYWMTGILFSAGISMPLLTHRGGGRLCQWATRTAEMMPMVTPMTTATVMNVCKPVHAIVDKFKLA